MSNLSSTFDDDNPFADTKLTVSEVTTSASSNLLDATISWLNIAFCIHVIISIINTAASLFLAIIILRFQNLRSQRTNLYLLHYALCNTGYYLSQPVILILLHVVMRIPWPNWAHCILGELEHVFLCLVFVFAAVLAVDHHIVSWKDSTEYLRAKIYLYTTCLCYTIGMVKLLICIIFCLTRTSVLIAHHFILLTFIIAVILVTVVTIREKERRKCYSLIAAQVIVYSWLGLLGYFTMDMATVGFDTNSTMFYVVSYTEWLPSSIAHGSTIILLWVLGRKSKTFRMAYMIALKKKFRDYREQDLDLDPSPEEETVGSKIDRDDPEADFIQVNLKS